MSWLTVCGGPDRSQHHDPTLACMSSSPLPVNWQVDQEDERHDDHATISHLSQVCLDMKGSGRHSDTLSRPPLHDTPKEATDDSPASNRAFWGGAGRTPETCRRRTRRINLCFQGEQTQLYVPSDSSRETIEQQLAAHVGYRSDWLTIHWQDPRNVSVTPNDQSPRLTTTLKQHLASLVQGITPTSSDRALLGLKDIYLGHRATRSRGITVATQKYAQSLRRLNAALKQLLPGATWNAVGLLLHGDIGVHVDDIATHVSYALTITAGTSAFKYTSPTTQQLRTTEVGVFDPTRAHGVFVSRRVFTLSTYTTRRAPALAS